MIKKSYPIFTDELQQSGWKLEDGQEAANQHGLSKTANEWLLKWIEYSCPSLVQGKGNEFSLVNKLKSQYMWN